MMFCNQCGNKPGEKDVFCNKCGNPLDGPTPLAQKTKNRKAYPWPSLLSAISLTLVIAGTRVISKYGFEKTIKNIQRVVFKTEQVEAFQAKEPLIEKTSSLSEMAVRAGKEILAQNVIAPSTIEWTRAELLEKDQYGRYLIDLVFESQNEYGVPIQECALVVLQSLSEEAQYTYLPLTVVTDYELPAYQAMGIEMAKSLNKWGLSEIDSLEENDPGLNDPALIKALEIAQESYPEFSNWDEGNYGEDAMGEDCIAFLAYSEELRGTYVVFVMEDGSCYARNADY